MARAGFEEHNRASRRSAEVVVVDDDPAVLGALKFALELEGFSVADYRSGSELLAQSELPQAGCLVIDFRLPDMNGLDLLAALRRSGVTLPAILITTNPSALIRANAAAAQRADRREAAAWKCARRRHSRRARRRLVGELAPAPHVRRARPLPALSGRPRLRRQ